MKDGDLASRNAVTSWGQIIGVLCNMATLPYLIEIIDNYFSDRKCLYQTDDGSIFGSFSVEHKVRWSTLSTIFVGFAGGFALDLATKTLG